MFKERKELYNKYKRTNQRDTCNITHYPWFQRKMKRIEINDGKWDEFKSLMVYFYVALSFAVNL